MSTRTVGRRGACVLALVALWAAACAAPEPIEVASGWLEVRSKNFHVISSLDESRTLEMVERLELFRVVVAQLTNVRSLEAAVPTRIYVFDSMRRFEPFRLSPASPGFFKPTMRDNVAALVSSRSMDALEILYHEYTHFVVYNSRSRWLYPKWFNEGFAELMGAFGVDGDHVRIGDRTQGRGLDLEYGRWLPLERIIDPVGYGSWSTSDKAMFYAQSWALVHYLMLGPNGSRFPEGMMHYLGALEQGVPPPDAFEQGFELDLERLEYDLPKYMDKHARVRLIRIAKFPYDAQATVRPLDGAEVASQLGWLSLALGRTEQAGTYFAAALSADPLHARAHSGMGDFHKFQSQYEEALPYYERSISLAPDDALNHLELAEYWHSRLMGSESNPGHAELFAAARHHYLRSHQLDPEIPETYAEYGSLVLEYRGRTEGNGGERASGRDLERGWELIEHAYEMLPSNLRIVWMVARARMATGRYEEAAQLLRRLRVRAHSEKYAKQLEEWLEIAENEGRPAPIGESSAPSEGPVVSR